MAGEPRRRRKEVLVRSAFLAAAGISIVISGLIVLSLLGKAVEFLRTIHLSQLWWTGWFPRTGQFDLKTIIVGSVLITAIAMVVATPLGLGAAIYLSEYARPRARRIIKPVLEVLAGIPSVVLGFFALTWISPNIVQHICGQYILFNVAAAGIGVGILVTPLIASVAEDALRAVPLHLREASFGVGATKKRTTFHVVAPAAVSGLAASLIIGISRAVGETMIVAIAAGASGSSLFSLKPCLPGQTMTAAIASLAIGSDQVGQAGSVPESLLRRFTPVLDDYGPEPGERAIRSAHEGEVLMATEARTGRLSTTDIVARGLMRNKPRVGEIAFEVGLLGALLICLATLVVLLETIIVGGWSIIANRGWDFIHKPLSSLPEFAGVWQGIIGSLLLMGFVVLWLFRSESAAAVYLEEYAKDNRFNRFVNVNIRNLAGVPSIVYGLLGVAVFVEAMRKFTGGPSVISGGLTLAVLVLPIVIITSAEALRAVPDSIREAGYGIGATRWEVIRSHVLPSAFPASSQEPSSLCPEPSERPHHCCLWGP